MDAIQEKFKYSCSIILHDGDGTPVKMTDPVKVQKLVEFCAGGSELKDLENFPKEEFSTFCRKLKMYATCMWSYLEPAKDLKIAFN